GSKNNAQTGRLDRCSDGCSQTQTIEFADRHAAFAPRSYSQAASGLPEVQHDEAFARDLPKLWQLRGPHDGRNRVAGSGELGAGSLDILLARLVVLHD